VRYGHFFTLLLALGAVVKLTTPRGDFRAKVVALGQLPLVELAATVEYDLDDEPGVTVLESKSRGSSLVASSSR
jgi:hypothetical protein